MALTAVHAFANSLASSATSNVQPAASETWVITSLGVSADAGGPTTGGEIYLEHWDGTSGGATMWWNAVRPYGPANNVRPVLTNTKYGRMYNWTGAAADLACGGVKLP